MKKQRMSNTQLFSEAGLHEAVCKYISLMYPGVIFNSDMSGVRLNKGQAIRASKLRSSRGFPDIVIYEPKYQDVQVSFSGCLFIELKAEGTKIKKKDGTLVANTHIREQAAMIQELRERGYVAEFACGFDQAKQIIDKYLDR